MTLFGRSCIVSVRNVENRFHSLEVHLAIAKSAEPCSWQSKGVDCQSSELDYKSLELDRASFELEYISCFHLLALCCLMYTFSVQKPSKKQQKLSVQRCLHKLCRKPLSEDPVLFAEAVQLSCRSCALVLKVFDSCNSFGFFMSCNVSSCDVH